MQIVRSIFLLFIADAIILMFSAVFAFGCFNFQGFLIGILNVILGLSILYLKDNYKIRELKISCKSAYLLFEGMIFFEYCFVSVFVNFDEKYIIFD